MVVHFAFELGGKAEQLSDRHRLLMEECCLDCVFLVIELYLDTLGVSVDI